MSVPDGTETDQRIIDRRREIFRANARRRRRILLVVLLTAVLGVVVWQVARSPLLGVADIRVNGAVETTSDEVVTASGVRLGEPLLLVETEAARTRVEELVWVDEVRVSQVLLPRAIRIDVTEHVPAAAVPGADGRTWLVAEDGTVLRTATDQEEDVPAVADVPAPPELAPGVVLGGDGALANALAALRSMDPELRAQVTGARAASVQTLELDLEGGTVLRYGAAERQPEKDTAALLVLADVGEQRAGVVVDVRAPRTPAIRRG